MDTTQWPQGIGVVKQPSMEAARGALTTADQDQQQSKRPRPTKEQAVNCPRCNSTNTKFCYYNNYSLTQPRYFCKTCRRYWTEGGSLRNVPVGGGSRKNNKRSTPTSPSPSSSPSSKKLLIPHDHHHPPPPHMMVVGPHNPRIQQLGGGGGSCQDLNLAYPPITSNTSTTASAGDYHMIFNPNPNLNSAVEFLKSSGANGVGSFLPISVSDSGAGIFPPGYHMQEFKPSLNFSIDGGFGNGYGGVVQESGGGGGGGGDTGSARLFFPFEEVKQSGSGPNTSGGGDQFEEHDDQQQEIQRGQQGQGEANGYWSGMLGGSHGGSW